MKIRTKITFLTSVIISLLMGALVYRLTNNFRKSTKESTYLQMENIVDMTANNINSYCEQEFQVIEALAKLPFIKDKEITLEEKMAQLISTLNSYNGKYVNLAFYDKEGYSIIAATGEKRSFATAEYFQGAIKGERWTRAPEFNQIAQSDAMFFSVPVYADDGEIIGAIVSIVKGNPIDEIVNDIYSKDGTHPVIVNLTNYVPVSDLNGNEQKDTFSDELKGIIFSGGKDIVTTDDQIVCFRPLSLTNPIEYTMPWTIITTADTKEVFLQVNKGVRQGFGALIALGIIIYFIISFMISRGFRHFTTVSKNIDAISKGKGDLTKEISIVKKDETRPVSYAFNKFVVSLKRIISEIKDNNARLVGNNNHLDKQIKITSDNVDKISMSIGQIEDAFVKQSDHIDNTAAAIEEITQNLKSFDTMIETQATSVIQASASINEMVSNINSVSINADKMGEAFRVLNQTTTKGIEMNKALSDIITEIYKKSELILEANKLVQA
ncbi:MAG: methyl-accepting chemotaxis protein, partial [Clostridia bacterium]|nr:methyl-accepting chemotaxis protein [Clostridia bacterium]